MPTVIGEPVPGTFAAEASVNVIRNMTLLLRPSMLDDFGLVPALEWQAREVSKRTGLRVHVSDDVYESSVSGQLAALSAAV